MKYLQRTLILSLVLALPGAASAQSAANEDPLPLPPAARAVLDSFDKPLHPIVGGVAPSGGMGVGIGYTTPESERWFHDGEARVTVNKYWTVASEAGRQTGRSRIGLFGQVRDMKRLDFFGLGPNSLHRERSDFALRETSVGARGWVRATPLLRLGGSAEFYSPSLGRGRSPLVPSVEESFGASSLPGLNDDANFGRYRGYAEIVYPIVRRVAAPAEEQSYQGTYQVAAEVVRDIDSGNFSFRRYETEIQQRFHGLKRGHRLTLHGLVAATDSGGIVPFYMQYTLGGGGSLSAFRPNTIGTDGTKATLRSFHDYRFRDRDLLLMQAEYRVPLHKSIDGTVFLDAGRVAPVFADLFGGLKAGTGFSLSFMRKGNALARLDIGYGSGEGMHFFWNFGGLLN